MNDQIIINVIEPPAQPTTVNALSPPVKQLQLFIQDPNSIPRGGAAGQLLSKASGTDYHAVWVDPPTSEVNLGGAYRVGFADGLGNITGSERLKYQPQGYLNMDDAFYVGKFTEIEYGIGTNYPVISMGVPLADIRLTRLSSDTSQAVYTSTEGHFFSGKKINLLHKTGELKMQVDVGIAAGTNDFGGYDIAPDGGPHHTSFYRYYLPGKIRGTDLIWYQMSGINIRYGVDPDVISGAPYMTRAGIQYGLTSESGSGKGTRLDEAGLRIDLQSNLGTPNIYPFEVVGLRFFEPGIIYSSPASQSFIQLSGPLAQLGSYQTRSQYTQGLISTIVENVEVQRYEQALTTFYTDTNFHGTIKNFCDPSLWFLYLYNHLGVETWRLNVDGNTNLRLTNTAKGPGDIAFSQKAIGIGVIPNSSIDIEASSAEKGQIRLAPGGVAPTGLALTDGTIWFDGVDLKMRIAGVTKTFTLTP